MWVVMVGIGSLSRDQYALLLRELPFGKHLPDSKYIHVCGLSLLPREYSELVEQAEKIASLTKRCFNVVKFHVNAKRVSLLSYPSFFDEGFPDLASSWTVDLEQLTAKARTYASEGNPPILHRKELLLPPDHPLQGVFSVLTRAAEEQGLLDDAKTIGRRAAWELKLGHLGLVVQGNELIERTVSQEKSDEEILRHKTALVRYELSSPMQQLWRHGFLEGDYSVFDYGCGRGDDVGALKAQGIKAHGWDPHFQAESPKLKSDVVNLGFVLNVIEDLEERREALTGAWDLADKLLVVATILGGRSVFEKFRTYRDGVLTRNGTFQKYFRQAELREYCELQLGREPVVVAPGIVFIFKDDDTEQAFLAARELSRRPTVPLPRVGRVRPDPGARKPTRWEIHSELIGEFWACATELGRMPYADEFSRSEELRINVGSLKTVFRHCLADFGADFLQARKSMRMADRLVYLALNFFEQRRSFKQLPESVRRDVKAFWNSHNRAREEAKDLLFSIGSAEVIYEACRAAEKQELGYLDGQKAFFFHSSVTPQLPAALRIYLGCAARIYGDFEGIDLIKLHIGSNKVSLMRYDDFSGRALPLLLERTKILLRAADYEVYLYGEEFPPPPLYLKGRYLPEDFPRKEDQVRFDESLSEAISLRELSEEPGTAELSEILTGLELEVHGFRLRRASRNRGAVKLVREEKTTERNLGAQPIKLAGSSENKTPAKRAGVSGEPSKESQMTILEAAIRVLENRDQPMPVADIYEAIVNQGLYTFGAKSPRSVLSGTIRGHLKKSPNPRIAEPSPGLYVLNRPSIGD